MKKITHDRYRVPRFVPTKKGIYIKMLQNFEKKKKKIAKTNIFIFGVSDHFSEKNGSGTLIPNASLGCINW